MSIVGACHPHEMDVVRNNYRPPMMWNHKHSTSGISTNKDAIMTYKRKQIKGDANCLYNNQCIYSLLTLVPNSFPLNRQQELLKTNHSSAV
jgi:hypothetical protein